MTRIAIIGGGIVGATCAYYLSKMTDSHITLIDDGEGQATKAACGIICPWLSQRRNQQWYTLVKEGANFYNKLMKDLQKDGIVSLPYVQTGTLIFKKKIQQLEKLMHMAEQRKYLAPMIGHCCLVDSQEIANIIPTFIGEQGAVLAAGGGRVDGALLVQQLKEIAQQRGVEVITGQAQLSDNQHVQLNNQQYIFDQIVLAAGAWLPQLLTPLGYQVDVRPQKGQLLELTINTNTDSLPGMMLHGEIDILPFNGQRLVIGATHENNQGYDLTPDFNLLATMQQEANKVIPVFQYDITKVRIGIRAYTSDYLPFFGKLLDSSLFVASGLGSSGLTSGPIIGYCLAQLVNKGTSAMDISAYCPSRYIQRSQ